MKQKIVKEMVTNTNVLVLFVNRIREWERKREKEGR